MIDTHSVPILYSVNTALAYRINSNYYRGIHYVWCTTTFHSQTQPSTSDPQAIANRWLQILSTRDRHAKEFNGNKVGILKGAEVKFNSGVINEYDYELIRQMVDIARYSDFYPALYLIHSDKVIFRCNEVPVVDKASDSSEEYRIDDLSESEFDVVEFKEINYNVVTVSEQVVGD